MAFWIQDESVFEQTYTPVPRISFEQTFCIYAESPTQMPGCSSFLQAAFVLNQYLDSVRIAEEKAMAEVRV